MTDERNSVNGLQKMRVVRSLRSESVPFCVTKFITKNLCSKFVEPAILDLDAVDEDSLPKTTNIAEGIRMMSNSKAIDLRAIECEHGKGR